MQITNENDSLNEFWTSTSGDLSQKREQVDIPKYQRTTGNASEIIIDPSVKKTRLARCRCCNHRFCCIPDLGCFR